MKLILTILFFYAVNIPYSIRKYLTSPATYYVSNAGSDGANGTSTGTSFLTPAHAYAVAANGDTVKLKCGDSFIVSQITLSSDGVYTTSYGTGSKPNITAFQTLSVSSAGGNIYTATATNAAAYLNMVLINGAVAHRARTPNQAYAFFDYPGGTKTHFVTKTLTGSEGYAGLQAVVRTASSVEDIAIIDHQSGADIYLRDTLTYDLNNNTNAYFIQNTPPDTLAEYSSDSTTKGFKCFAVGGTPTVQIATIDTLIKAYKKNNLTFDNISFTGANQYGVFLDSCLNLTIKNCSFTYIGEDGIEIKYCHNATLQNNTIKHCMNNGIHTRASVCNDGIVAGNTVDSAGYLHGMSLSGNNKAEGIFWLGANLHLYNNIINYTGYDGIAVNGDNKIVEYNFITNFCFIKDDGGGIYQESLGYTNTGTIFRYNIIGNSTGAALGGIGQGSNYPFPNAGAGIYLDGHGPTTNVSVVYNTIYNTTGYALLTQSDSYISIKDNTIVDSTGRCLYIGISNHNDFKRNILYQKRAISYCLETFGVSVSTIDTNYYLKSVTTAIAKSASTSYTLSEWISASGYDVHTGSMPTGITGAGTLYINPTDHDSIVVFSGIKKDGIGTLYLGSATLHSYCSKLFFTSSSPYVNRIAGRLFN